MGKNDVAVKKWLSGKERFADLESAEGEADVIIKDKNGKER